MYHLSANKISCLLLSMLLFVCVTWAKPKAARGEIRGHITDNNMAFVSDAKLIIKGNNFHLEVKSQPDGTYALNLPTGLYTMAVEKYGFCPTRRGLFKMPAKSIIFDFSLFPCPIVNSLSIVEGKPQQEKDEYQHFWKEDAIKQVSPNFHSFDLLIKYGDKKLDSRFTTYKGFADNSGVTHRVELIYNLTTIWADKVYVNASHTEAVLEGKVLIVNNLYRREFEKAITIFNRGKVKIKFAN